MPSRTLVSLAIHDAFRDNTGGLLESWLNGRETEHAGRLVPFFADGKRKGVLSHLEAISSLFAFSTRLRTGFGFRFVAFSCIFLTLLHIAFNYSALSFLLFGPVGIVPFLDLPSSSRFSSFASCRPSFLALLSLSLSLLALVSLVSIVPSCTCPFTPRACTHVHRSLSPVSPFWVLYSSVHRRAPFARSFLFTLSGIVYFWVLGSRGLVS